MSVEGRKKSKRKHRAHSGGQVFEQSATTSVCSDVMIRRENMLSYDSLKIEKLIKIFVTETFSIYMINTVNIYIFRNPIQFLRIKFTFELAWFRPIISQSYLHAVCMEIFRSKCAHLLVCVSVFSTLVSHRATATQKPLRRCDDREVEEEMIYIPSYK